MDSPPGRPPTFAATPRTPVFPKLLATPESPEALEPPLPANMQQVLLTPGLPSSFGNMKHPKEEKNKSAPLAVQPSLSTKQSNDTLPHTYVDTTAALQPSFSQLVWPLQANVQAVGGMTAAQVVHLSQSLEFSNAEKRKSMTTIPQFPNSDSFQCDVVSRSDNAAPSLPVNMTQNLATKFDNNESDNEMPEEEKSAEP